MGQGGWRGIPLSTACPIESRGLDRRDKVGGPLINARWSGGTLTVSEGNFPRTPIKEVANSFSISPQPFARSVLLRQSKRPQGLTMTE